MALLERALDELQQHDVLYDWTKQERRGPRNRLDDVLYTLVASMGFVAHMKAGNKRRSNSIDTLAKSNLLPSPGR